jgi:hypothetical protein
LTRLAAAVRGVVWFLGALTLVALLDRFSPYFELLTFFRVQYAALLLVALVIALVVRLHRVALAAIVWGVKTRLAPARNGDYQAEREFFGTPHGRGSPL